MSAENSRDEHECLHEVDLALMGENIQMLCKDQREILRILRGNGSEGLIVDVAITKKGLSRAWYWLSAVSLSIITGALILLYRG